MAERWTVEIQNDHAATRLERRRKIVEQSEWLVDLVIHVNHQRDIEIGRWESWIMSVAAQNKLVGYYCSTCHDDEAKTGGLTLQSFDAAHRLIGTTGPQADALRTDLSSAFRRLF